MISIWEILGIVAYLFVFAAASRNNLKQLRILVICSTLLFVIQDVYFAFWTNVALGLIYVSIHLSKLIRRPNRKSSDPLRNHSEKCNNPSCPHPTKIQETYETPKNGEIFPGLERPDGVSYI